MAVVTCPACQQKARVPESMLGQPVKCPACRATFPAPAAEPPEHPPAAEPPPVRAALPAEADALRAARAAAGVQLYAHGIYALGLAAFLLLSLVAITESMAPPGVRNAFGDVLPILLVLAGSIVVLAAGLLNVVGSAIAILSPPAELARGLAVAVLALATIAFLELATTFSWVLMLFDLGPQRIGNPGGLSWAATGVVAWFVEIARLSVLACYWRAVSRILRDARGSALARRLAVGGPAAQVLLGLAWVVLGLVGAPGEALILLALVGWLTMQLIVVLAGVAVVARLRRRLRAAVPD